MNNEQKYKSTVPVIINGGQSDVIPTYEINFYAQILCKDITPQSQQFGIFHITDRVNSYIDIQIKKENIYITGIKNLLKTKKFLQLCIEHSSKNIKDKEFEKEIKKNRNKYVIDVRPLRDIDELDIINEITHKISNEFTVDEVSEIFSISSESIINAIKPFMNKK